ncbi:MAG: VanZ family protein [Rubrivivax sp.]|nr:VanZ family protein [Rubrivivax sp.]
MTALPTEPARHPTPHMARHATPEPAQGRFWLLLGALAFLAFVVYGSLVPLRFQALPWDQALERFRSMPYLALGIGSRADWVANILLFIPLCFLWAGVVWPQRRSAWRVVAAGLLFVAAVALSVAIEFVQLYFPPRTVSLNDIVAEATGAAIGIGLWWAFGRHASRWLQALPLARGTASVAQRLLAIYLLALFGYNLLPLDLTISPVEVYHKWREGKVIWLPFTTHYADSAQRAYDLVTDIAIWVPAAVLWVLAGQKTRLQAWTAAVTAAFTLELMQLFVYSRVSDSTDVVTAALGAAIGVALLRPRVTESSDKRTPQKAGALRWAVAGLCWLIVLAAIFWYPFDFNLDRNFLRERVAGLDRVPLEAYYYGTEFRAITEVLRKSLFLAPLGLILYRLGQSLPTTWPRWVVHWSMLALVAACATLVEGVQLLLPGKNADFTDLALEFLGGLIAYAGTHFVAQGLAHGPPVPHSTPMNGPIHAARPVRTASPRGLSSPALAALLLPSGIAVAVALIALRVLARLPQVPYNIRELLAPPGAPWASAVVAFAALLVFGMPSVVATAAALRPAGLPVARTVTLLCGIPGIAAAVLFLGGPTESVRDLVGNAAFAWWPWGETWVRLSVLFLGVVWSVALGCALQGLPVTKGYRGSAIAHLLMHGIWIVPVWHAVVVYHATTDNLTELMSGGGTWLSSICLLAYVTLWAATASSLLASLVTRSGPALIRSLLWVAASVIAGYGLVSAATEPAVVKYGQGFSALQFLLSADRSAYATGTELLLRFAAAHVLTCLGAACAMAAVLAPAARYAAVRRALEA